MGSDPLTYAATSPLKEGMPRSLRSETRVPAFRSTSTCQQQSNLH